MKSCYALVVVAIVATASGIGAGEQTISIKDLPAPVRDAVLRELMDAKLKGLATETKGDKMFYEAETEMNGQSRDLLFDATGKLIEVEEEMAVGDAPAAVKAALEKRGKILKLERVTTDTGVRYDGVVEKGATRSDVAVDAEGKSVTD